MYYIFNLNPVSRKDIDLTDKPINQGLHQCVGVAYFLNNFTLFQLCFIIALYLFGLCGNGGMDIPCLHQLRIIYRLALLLSFQVKLSKCILFIKLPFAVLDRVQLFFVPACWTVCKSNLSLLLSIPSAGHICAQIISRTAYSRLTIFTLTPYFMVSINFWNGA